MTTRWPRAAMNPDMAADDAAAHLRWVDGVVVVGAAGHDDHPRTARSGGARRPTAGWPGTHRAAGSPRLHLVDMAMGASTPRQRRHPQRGRARPPCPAPPGAAATTGSVSLEAQRPAAAAPVGAQPGVGVPASSAGGRARLFGADDAEAPLVDGVEEPVEGGLDRGQVAVVVVGGRGRCWWTLIAPNQPEQQEGRGRSRAVATKMSPSPECGLLPELVEVAADREGTVDPARRHRQLDGQHRRRRGLAEGRQRRRCAVRR